MNNYIINPSVFYWINVYSTLRAFSIAFFVISIMAAIGCTIGALYNHYESSVAYNNDQRERYLKGLKLFKRITIIATVVVVLSGLFIIFLPNKTTSIEMLIARTATYENAELTVQGIKEVVDYIISAIKSIT